LLFYRRRSNSPLGGKSFHKIEEAKQQPSNAEVDVAPVVTIDTHLPTPPNEPTSNRMSNSIAPHFPHLHSEVNQEQWNLRSAGSNAGSSLPSPPADDPTDDPIDAQDYSHDALFRATQRYDFYPSKPSPTSSNEADADADEVVLDWGSSPDHFEDEVKDVLPDDRSPDWDTVSTLASSSYSDFSDINNAFSDANNRKIEDTTLKPLHEKTT
jgi:ubiquitin carboxyl-terminal hydrolase 4/11